MKNEIKNEAELIAKIESMTLSQIQMRLEEISNIFSSRDKTIIDQIIPLDKEAKLLKAHADKELGQLDRYLEDN